MDTLSVEITADAAPVGVYGDPVTYSRDGTLFAKFFLRSIERTSKRRWKLDAVSAVGLLDNVKHYGGVYSGTASATVISDIIGGIFPVTVTGFSDVRVYGWLPIASRRENLQQVLFAIGGNITKDSSGNVVISPLSESYADELGKDRVFLGGKVTYPAGASAVRVTEHSYTQGGETKEIYNGEVLASALTSPAGASLTGQLIEFRDPAWGLECNGSTILESGANYAVLAPSPAAVLTGKGYIHNTKVITVYADDADGEELVPEVKDCTLVSLANSANVAQRVLAYYSGFKTVQQDIAAEGSDTVVRPGDRVVVYDPYGERSGAYIKTMALKLGALLRGSVVFDSGYTPSGVGNNYKDVTAITSSGTVTLPNTNLIRLVIIGGGTGGNGGFPGEDGKQPSSGSSTDTFLYGELEKDGDAYWVQVTTLYAPASSWISGPRAEVSRYSPPTAEVTGIKMTHYIDQHPEAGLNPNQINVRQAAQYGYGNLLTSSKTYAKVVSFNSAGTMVQLQGYKAVAKSGQTGENWMIYDSLTPGGAGGNGGAGGLGGKIYIVDVEITPGASMTVSLGTGGAGGDPADGAEGSDPAGSDGTATTVTVGGTTYTSADGMIYPDGYVDIIGGGIYGAVGDAGTPGGDGGASEGYYDVYPGEDVGEYHGGAVVDSGTLNPSGSGGGASGTANGSPGTTAVPSHRGAGGAGASANTAPSAPASGGQGGTGGYGGGGGGNAAGWRPSSNSYTVADPAPGGAGSGGGAGAPGIVLIYHGDPVDIPPEDALKDWYKQAMTDKDGKDVTVTGGYRSKYSGWQIDDFIGEVLGNG